MMQTALEAEVDEFLGRARYQRRTDEGRPGSRNGWQPPAAVKTTMGPVELQRPKLRGIDEAFCSRLFGAGVTRTNALESLVISGWVRGLSDRDIEAALAEVLGAEAALSKSTVSRICQRIRDEFEAWRHRDLGAVRLDYLFLDGSHFKMHAGTPARRPSLCWPPGASTPTASRCWWVWRRRHPAPRREFVPVAGVGGAGPRQPRLARPHDDPEGAAPAAGPTPPAPAPAGRQGGDPRGRHRCRVASSRSPRPEPFTPLMGRHPVLRCREHRCRSAEYSGAELLGGIGRAHGWARRGGLANQAGAAHAAIVLRRSPYTAGL